MIIAKSETALQSYDIEEVVVISLALGMKTIVIFYIPYIH